MQIFYVAYSKKKDIIDETFQIEKKAEELTEHYQKYLSNKLNTHIFNNERIVLIYITDLLLNQHSCFLNEENGTVAFSAGTPAGLNKLFARYNAAGDDNKYLLKLKKLFETQGLNIIAELSPPFIFGFIDKNRFQIMHDGLGFEQGYVYQNDDFWMCSNKCWPIVHFSGDKFNVNIDGWVHYFQSSWFQALNTPFAKINYLGAGEIWDCSPNRIERKEVDCWERWLKPNGMTKKDTLEFARINFNQAIEELVDRYCKDSVLTDLSGGRDSRAIVSALLHLNIECEISTVGEKYSADVHVVKMIEKQLGLKVNFTNSSIKNIGQNEFIEKLNQFILWQDGFGEIKSCKYIDTKPRALDSTHRFQGLMGGFYKGTSYPKSVFNRTFKDRIKAIARLALKKDSNQARNREKFFENRDKLLKFAKQYGLKGYSLLDYFGFMERGRRWSSACASSNICGSLLPFLNVELINSNFSLSPKDKILHRLHDHIISQNNKKLSLIPYASDIVSKDEKITKKVFDEDLFWRSLPGVQVMDKITGSDHYLWEILEKGKINEIWAEHKEKQKRHGEYFWRIAGFYFWYQVFGPYLTLQR